MCGISGIVLREKSIKGFKLDVDKLSLILNHRGPDYNNHVITKDQKKIFFFNRLKIIDLSDKSNQPILTKKKILLFNGELYNFRELGSRYFPEEFCISDTIFLSKLCNLKNFHNLLGEIRGMYSIAIYDQSKNFLNLYRDYFGIKPLFYFINDEVFIFSSEIKFIINALNLNNHECNFNEYFELGYNLENKTIYKKIISLDKNSMLNFDVNKWCSQKKIINELNYNKKSVSNTYTINENLKKSIRDSIKRNLVSDKPITILQSSGLDSNLIISEMKKYQDSVESYTINFQENNFDESKDIRNINKKNSIKSNYVEFSVTDFLDIFQNYNLIFDQPFFDPSSFPMLKLFKVIKKKYDVAISGDGGDEMFLGYNRYHLKNNQILKFLFDFKLINKNLSTSIIKNLLQFLGYKNVDYKSRKLINFYIEKNKFKSLYQNINSPNLKSEIYTFEKGGQLDEILHFDINNYLPNNILYKSDLVSMARGVELRVPFLDEDLIVLKSSLKNKIKKKLLFKEMLYENNYYYPSIPKRGFDVPLSVWVEAILNNYSFSKLNEHKFENTFHYSYFLNQIEKNVNDQNKNYLFLFNRLLYLKWSNII